MTTDYKFKEQIKNLIIKAENEGNIELATYWLNEAKVKMIYYKIFGEKPE